MDANTIGINRFGAIGMISAGIGGILSGAINPSAKNLRAVVAVIDGVLGFEKQLLGDGTDGRVTLEIFKGYRSAAISAMSVKKHERNDFLRQSNVKLLKMIMDKHDGFIKAEMARMDKSERAVMQSAIDAAFGKKERPKLRVV